MGSRCAVPAMTVVHIGVTLVFVIQNLVCLLSGNWHFFNGSRNYGMSLSCLRHCCHEGSGSLIWRTNSWNCALCMDTVTWRCAVPTVHPTLTQYSNHYITDCIPVGYSVGQSLPSPYGSGLSHETSYKLWLPYPSCPIPRC